MAYEYRGPAQVYFIRPAGERGPIKIGCSSAPHERLKAYAAWSPQVLEIAALLEGGEELAHRFHGQFAHLRLHHEWFKADPAIDAVIAAINTRTFDVETLGPPARLRQERGWTEESRRAASYARKLERLRKRGVVIPPEVQAATYQWRMPLEEVERRRAIIREFVDRSLKKDGGE